MGSVGATQSSTLPSSLLEILCDRPGDKKLTAESWWKKIEKNTRARKVIYEIDGAMTKLKDPSKVNNSVELSEQLKDIFSYNTRKLGLECTQIRLLSAAVNELNDMGVGDADLKSTSFYLVICALSSLDGTMAFDPFQANSRVATKSKSAFQSAVSGGLTPVVEVMLEHLRATLRDIKGVPNPMESALAYLNKPHNGTTAFQMAVGGNTDADTDADTKPVVELLLRHYPTLADSDSLLCIINRTGDSSSGDPKSNSKHESRNKSNWNGNDANDQDDSEGVSQAIRQNAFDIFKLIMEKNESARFVVQNGNVSMWEKFPKEKRCEFLARDKCDLLHNAVACGKADLVKTILDESPAQIDISIGDKDASTGEKDASTGEKDASTGEKDASTGVKDASTGEKDASTGEKDTSTREKDASTGEKDASTGVKDASTGEKDASTGEKDTSTREKDPSTGKKDAEKYPLEHLTIEAGAEAYNNIRDQLVHAMIRSEKLEIQHIREILRKSKVDADQMCLYFPQFRTEAGDQSFSNYVLELKDIDPKIFQFEKVLKYATFPELNSQYQSIDREELRLDHREIRTIFDWLKKHDIQEVMSLTVDDRLFCPHSDNDVAFCVNTFAVRTLKWRKLDMYLGNLDKNRLKEVYLYSSGNRSVLEQWYEQLPKFTELKRLHVYVVENVLSDSRVKEVIKELQGNLNQINEKHAYRWEDNGEDTHEDRGTGPKDRKANIKVTSIRWIQQQEIKIYRSPNDITSDLGGQHLASFIRKFHNHYRENVEVPKTKVALIDSGVILVGGGPQSSTNGPKSTDKSQAGSFESRNPRSGSNLAKQIAGGISLVSKDNEEQTWWHATDPHGTQMATLICSINPCCELYVVKVAESNASGVTAHNIARAIKWAQSKGVDIISLSLVAFSEQNKEMAKAIDAAKKQDIVVVCSTADEGNVAARSVKPNEERDVFSIAACDRWGNLLPQSQKEDFEYQFIGHNVRVGQVPFLKSDECITGSSVSTAVASSMASLILACGRISKRSGPEQESWRCRLVRHVFNNMAMQGEHGNKKYVVLEDLCGKGVLGAAQMATFLTLVKGLLGNFQ